MSGLTKNGRLSVYEKYMYCTLVYFFDESLSKDETVLIYMCALYFSHVST